MPSFLNKVFGYKKNDDKEAAHPTRGVSDNALLDGKYEAILPILSPTAPTFTEAQPTKDLDRDAGFSVFRPKSRGVFQKLAQKHPQAVPHLTLQLPGPKEKLDSRPLGVVFEADPDSQTVLDDAVIAAKRLNPLEALILIRACAQAITERGLETLGIMHPHWFSSSPDVQRKLISLFIRSLTPQSRITTLSPTPTSATSAFENELHYTRSPHDVAAVLRWGLRHLSLENGHFGKDGTEWAWYNVFFHAERNASYPPKGFSELLLPQLPASHIELLTATLILVSSLASHAEANSISGSKLSKFLGVWLLVATRAEQSDDWNRFYARWERAGRIMEHLFLARLREESFVQCLPTRLQELVKYYPYNKGSLATEDGLFSRPRFSTRQYDALFIRVETLLMHGAEQPKQHLIQLLLEAFQLPTENPSGEGPQFTRIFVDETIQLLSLILADNNVPTSPTLLASPITKVMSRKRSSSLTKALERNAPRSSANNGSTPVSPISPSSPMITDWAQFSLSGFGDNPTTPLVALLDQDDDIEVTQPRISRKSSRQRGKSRSRRRRSEDREPPDTPPSSQSKPEPIHLHVIQIDEAFIDFWSDAIVDPISANWPTFVICGLKQIPGAEQPIRWLVIEQTYIHQQPPRVPSPEGHRGRSPRPSFRSDISGFRINSMFSSARKRLSVFSKSTTDLDPKKLGGKNPIAGELGEVLAEEEPTSPAVTGGATANVANKLKVDEISTALIAGIPPVDLVPVLEEEPNPVQAAAKAPSVEPTPQTGGYNGSSAPPRSSVRTSEEAVSVEQGSLQTLDVANSKVNAADPVRKIAPLTADTFDSRPTQDTSDPTASGPALSAEHPVTEEVQNRAEPFRQDIAPDGRPVKLVAQPVDNGEHLSAEFTGEPSHVVQVDVADGSREVAEAVAMPSAPETVAVDDEAPKHITEEPHVAEQASRKVPADFVTASTVESVGQHDDLLLMFASVVQNKVATETGAQLESDSIGSVVGAVGEAKEVAEHVEIPTPAPRLMSLVKGTPGREVSVDPYRRAGAAQNPAAGPEGSDDVATQPVAPDLQATLNQKTRVMAAETEHAADQVPDLTTEEAQPFVEDTIVQAAGALLAEALPIHEVEASVSATQESEDVILAEVDPAQAAPESSVPEACIVKTHDTGARTPIPENVALVDEAPGTEIAAEVYEPVPPESEAVEDQAPESFVEAVMGAKVRPAESTPLAEAQPSIEAELPSQVPCKQLVEALSTESITEAGTISSATADEIIAVKAEAKPAPNAPTDDTEVHAPTPVPESAPTGDTLEVAIEASKATEVILITAADSEPVTEPVVEEPEVLVKDEASSASKLVAVAPTVIIEESVIQHVQVPTEIEEPVPQKSPEDAEPVPPAYEVDVPLEETLAVVDAGEPEILATAAEADETSAANGPQEVFDLVEQSVRSDVEVSTIHEPTGLSEEIAVAEP
ncbi:hypothetical protein J3R83DRAFT_11417 [Lanmaoa asiatica]|nr:hypothetical protein J3R83DRAFT_11417 [Lanmaoa asiatica]